MKFNYYEETDSLYIDLMTEESVDSVEIRPGIVLDFNGDNKLVGIDIDQASTHVDLKHLFVNALPLEDFKMTKAG